MNQWLRGSWKMHQKQSSSSGFYWRFYLPLTCFCLPPSLHNCCLSWPLSSSLPASLVVSLVVTSMTHSPFITTSFSASLLHCSLSTVPTPTFLLFLRLLLSHYLCVIFLHLLFFASLAFLTRGLALLQSLNTYTFLTITFPSLLSLPSSSFCMSPLSHRSFHHMRSKYLDGLPSNRYTFSLQSSRSGDWTCPSAVIGRIPVRRCIMLSTISYVCKC